MSLSKTQSSESFDAAFLRAKQGEVEAVGDLLESYRSYLQVLAASEINGRLQRRVSPSDIVQDTMLAAHRDFAAFQGDSAPQFTAWLRSILTRNVFRAIERHIKAEKRDIHREVSMEAIAKSIDSSSIRLANILASDEATPSRIASNDEESSRVVELMQSLPEHYQTVIMYRNFQGLRFDEVANEMGRTATATRLLWLRAVRRLKELYEKETQD